MIYIASDHAGFALKEELTRFLVEQGYEVEDCGPDQLNEEDDYPDFIIPCAERVAAGDHKGIVIGGSGQGEAMAANKVKGIRAVEFYSGPDEIIKLSREHNDANVLSLGARFLDTQEACRIVKLWLDTSFSGDARHVRRLEKIKLYELNSQ